MSASRQLPMRALWMLTVAGCTDASSPVVTLLRPLGSFGFYGAVVADREGRRRGPFGA